MQRHGLVASNLLSQNRITSQPPYSHPYFEYSAPFSSLASACRPGSLTQKHIIRHPFFLISARTQDVNEEWHPMLLVEL